MPQVDEGKECPAVFSIRRAVSTHHSYDTQADQELVSSSYQGKGEAS